MKRNKTKRKIFIRPKRKLVSSFIVPDSNLDCRKDDELTPSELSFEEGIDSVESEGCVCKKCGDFFPFAEPNQEDKSFVCFACRNNI
jgi:hypothetical protein